MDRKFFLGIGVAVAIVFFVAAFAINLPKQAEGTSAERDTLYQVSTIDAVMQGVFDGVRTVDEVKKHGDFGTGTFEGLDGEMIILDGRVYWAKSDGRIYPASGNMTVPFASITYFDRDLIATTGRPMNLTELSATLLSRLPSQNMLYAVRMHGTFPSVKIRAIPAQHKPYPTLPEAAKNQSVFTYSDTAGTVLGFYTPAFLKGINLVGFHLHFISDDRLTGGHVLDLTAPQNLTVEFDVSPSFEMVLPTSGGFVGADFSQDLSAALAKVE